MWVSEIAPNPQREILILLYTQNTSTILFSENFGLFLNELCNFHKLIFICNGAAWRTVICEPHLQQREVPFQKFLKWPLRPKRTRFFEICSKPICLEREIPLPLRTLKASDVSKYLSSWIIFHFWVLVMTAYFMLVCLMSFFTNGNLHVITVISLLIS